MEATDGGIVHSPGSLARHFLPASEGAGQFAQVTFIHRIDTTGGLPPSATPCDAQHAGGQERVPYSATYLFYAR